MKISVAMAYYNGGMYIEEQMDTILTQLGEQDEVIVSVDGASDGSKPLLLKMAEEDKRIHVIKGPGKGVVKNFENAIRHCSGEIIYLSDQDDIWKPDKVKKVNEAFLNPKVKAVLHDAQIVDECGNPTGAEGLFANRGSRKGILKNLVKNSYVGCCMAFRRELIPVICPIPKEMYMHDYWIGTAAEYMGEVCFIKEPLIDYRRHSSNVTQMTHGRMSFMIKKRIDIVRCLRLLKRRVKEAGEEIEKVNG